MAAGVQIIVSDGLSEDNSLDLAANAGANIAMGQASRGGQLRRGAALASNDWMLFLHADCTLSENWLDLIQHHINHHPSKAGFFGLKYNSPKLAARWVELMVTWRSFPFPFGWTLPYGDQGLLMSRSLYEETGGYPDWPLFEDVKIAEKLGPSRLRNLGGKITTCHAKHEDDGFIKRGWRNFKLLRRYKRGDEIEALFRDYH